MDLENGVVRTMCGPDPEIICQVRGCYENHVVLCDYPVGDGETCDKRVCRTHRTHASENSDYCPDHRTQQREQKITSARNRARRGEVQCL